MSSASWQVQILANLERSSVHTVAQPPVRQSDRRRQWLLEEPLETYQGLSSKHSTCLESTTVASKIACPRDPWVMPAGAGISCKYPVVLKGV